MDEAATLAQAQAAIAPLVRLASTEVVLCIDGGHPWSRRLTSLAELRWRDGRPLHAAHVQEPMPVLEGIVPIYFSPPCHAFATTAAGGGGGGGGGGGAAGAAPAAGAVAGAAAGAVTGMAAGGAAGGDGGAVSVDVD